MRRAIFLLTIALCFTTKSFALCTVSPCTFTSGAGYTQYWVVPAGVTSVTVTMNGAGGGGGGGGDCEISVDGSNGGYGFTTTITSSGLSLEVRGGGGGGASGGGSSIGCGSVDSNGSQHGSNIGIGLTFTTYGGSSGGSGGSGWFGAATANTGSNGDYGTGAVSSVPGATWTITLGVGGDGGSANGGRGTNGGQGIDGTVTISWVTPVFGFPGFIRSSLDDLSGPCWIDERSRRKEMRA
jgi:hypothetical protein